MKIKLSFTVHIDPKKYAEHYDIEIGDVREDIWEYVWNMITTQLWEVMGDEE